MAIPLIGSLMGGAGGLKGSSNEASLYATPQSTATSPSVFSPTVAQVFQLDSPGASAGQTQSPTAGAGTPVLGISGGAWVWVGLAVVAVVAVVIIWRSRK